MDAVPGEADRGGEEPPLAGEEAAGEAARASTANEDGSMVFYKTKVVEFLGRTTPIILQNDNGPCPLLAICNILLLRNNTSLSLETSEVSQQKLLSLVAERLLDSNSNVEGKDEGYIKNQQKNIADAIDLLPRLTSGIDVNVLFRKINDFEFTPECAIFDLFDIGLYHGWIVDPQDEETAAAIGSKSYNALVAELVEHDTRSSEGEKHLIEDNSIDFAAATTAALGVPCPCLSRSLSCSDSPMSVQDEQKSRKGDLEEEAELMRVLKLSRAEQEPPITESLSPDTNLSDVSSSSEDRLLTEASESGGVSRVVVAHEDNFLIPAAAEVPKSSDQGSLGSQDGNNTCEHRNDKTILTQREFEKDEQAPASASIAVDGHPVTSIDSTDVRVSGTSTQGQAFYFHPFETNNSSDYAYKCLQNDSGDQYTLHNGGLLRVPENCNTSDDANSSIFTSQAPSGADFHFIPGVDTADGSILDKNEIEPLYEGEECILDSAPPDYGNSEPVYEGEVILAEQADRVHLIRNFLKENASQLTIYGLFSLQEGLKERELSVFFRNNHFSTLFKYNGELYLLATDQGYMNQQDLVWEKLNEVNGDTMFMTGNFKEFIAGDQACHSWDEPNTVNEYLALEGSTSGNSTFKSDHQLAMELQQQEFEKQPQCQQPQKPQTPSGSGRSRLVTGTQVSRYSTNPSQRQDSKSKDKCTLM